MPQLDSFACTELAGLPSMLTGAIVEAEMPGLGEGPHVKPLAVLLNLLGEALTTIFALAIGFSFVST